MKAARIVQALEALKLDAWSVLFQEQEKSTLHLTKGSAVETSMSSRRVQAEVTVYKRSGTYLGDAKFTLFTDDPAVIASSVRDALVIAGESLKPAWPLPGKQRYGRVATADPRIVAAFKEGRADAVTLRLWRAMSSEAARMRGVALNHAELHLTSTRNLVVNSEGLRGRSAATTLFVEAIVTARQRGKGELEFHDAVTVGALRSFSPRRFVRATAEAARDVLRAQKWRRVHKGGILLSGAALRDFWAPDLTQSPVVAHANAQAKHRRLSRFEAGQRVTANTAFSLTSDPFVPFNPASGRFDGEGTASRQLTLVDRGVCTGFVANQRYAHYLGVPPTGALGVISLSPGRERAAALRAPGTVEIVSFSSFVPNSLSGDFSAEIRLGYVYMRDGKNGRVRRVPIRGAMFTGNVFAMLNALRASKEQVELERYQGPAVVRFDEGCHLAGF